MYGRFFVLFALMATGYVLARKKVFEESATRAINKFIVYFAYPCLVVEKISGLDMNSETMGDFLLTLVLSTLLLYLGHGAAHLYSKARRFPRENAHVAEFAMASPNDGFMGFPVALLFFGEWGLLFMLAHNAALNLYFFTLGITTMRKGQERKNKITFLKIGKRTANLLMNPNILALIVGLLLCDTGIALPLPLRDYFTYIGNVATPMAMIYIGTSLADSNLLTILKNKEIVECSLMKLVWLPLLTYGLVAFLPLSQVIKATCVLGACFPTAATVPMLAQQEGQDARLSSEILFLSTILSAVTIPLSVQLIQLFVR